MTSVTETRDDATCTHSSASHDTRFGEALVRLLADARCNRYATDGRVVFRRPSMDGVCTVASYVATFADGDARVAARLAQHVAGATSGSVDDGNDDADTADALPRYATVRRVGKRARSDSDDDDERRCKRTAYATTVPPCNGIVPHESLRRLVRLADVVRRLLPPEYFVGASYDASGAALRWSELNDAFASWLDTTNIGDADCAVLASVQGLADTTAGRAAVAHYPTAYALVGGFLAARRHARGTAALLSAMMLHVAERDGGDDDENASNGHRELYDAAFERLLRLGGLLSSSRGCASATAQLFAIHWALRLPLVRVRFLSPGKAYVDGYVYGDLEPTSASACAAARTLARLKHWQV